MNRARNSREPFGFFQHSFFYLFFFLHEFLPYEDLRDGYIFYMEYVKALTENKPQRAIISSATPTNLGDAQEYQNEFS